MTASGTGLTVGEGVGGVSMTTGASAGVGEGVTGGSTAAGPLWGVSAGAGVDVPGIGGVMTGAGEGCLCSRISSSAAAASSSTAVSTQGQMGLRLSAGWAGERS